jgi:hypothetical protein
LDFTGIFSGKLFNHWPNGLTGAAPGSPEVNQA